jgi:transcriptional regulator with XRE-family HTH domain
MSGTNSTLLRESVAKNIRLIRNNLGLSQEELAEQAGLHRTYIGSIERAERNVSIDNIEKIARALKVQPHELLKGRR